MLRYFIIGLVFLLLFTGCSKEKDLNNMRICQESCLTKNMSFNSLTSFDNSTNNFIKCSCDVYVEVS
jgi:hypothetical protein